MDKLPRKVLSKETLEWIETRNVDYSKSRANNEKFMEKQREKEKEKEKE